MNRGLLPLNQAAPPASLADKSTWTVATAYAVGDIVTNAGVRYVANTAGTSSSAFSTDIARWTALDASTQYNSAGSTYNITEANFRRWRAALANQRIGTSIARILWIGDSSTAGTGATAGTERTASAPGRLVSFLSGKLGSGAVVDGFTTNLSYSTAGQNGWTLGTGWTAFGSEIGPMQLVFANAGAAGTLDVVSPGGINWDTAEIIFTRKNACGVDVWADAGAHTTYSITASSGFVTKTFSAGSSGNHTLHIGTVTGTQVRVAAVALYDSTQTQRGIMISNYGASGTVSGDWSSDTSSFGLTTTLGVLPHLTIINLGINDAKTAVHIAAATYQTNMTAIINAAKAVGSDVVLVVPQQYDPSSIGTYGDHSYLDTVIYTMADSLGCGVLDLRNRWGTCVTYTANGYGGYPHPNSTGYADEAQGMLDLILSAA